jgi:hypothetical protein
MLKIWRAFYRFALCHHWDMVRERNDGVWYFACQYCGYRVPIIRRYPGERKSTRG